MPPTELWHQQNAPLAKHFDRCGQDQCANKWSLSVQSTANCVTAPCNEKCLRYLFSEHLGTSAIVFKWWIPTVRKVPGLFEVQRQSLQTHALVNITRRMYSKEAFSIMLKWSKQTKPFEMTSSVKSARAGECCLPGHAVVHQIMVHTLNLKYNKGQLTIFVRSNDTH